MVSRNGAKRLCQKEQDEPSLLQKPASWMLA